MYVGALRRETRGSLYPYMIKVYTRRQGAQQPPAFFFVCFISFSYFCTYIQ